MTIIEQIDKIRDARGMSKRALSVSAEITPEYYSKLVAGKSTASVVIIEKLAQAVECKLCLCFE